MDRTAHSEVVIVPLGVYCIGPMGSVRHKLVDCFVQLITGERLVIHMLRTTL